MLCSVPSTLDILIHLNFIITLWNYIYTHLTDVENWGLEKLQSHELPESCFKSCLFQLITLLTSPRIWTQASNNQDVINFCYKFRLFKSRLIPHEVMVGQMLKSLVRSHIAEACSFVLFASVYSSGTVVVACASWLSW